MVTTQAPVPEQLLPLQPVKIEPAAAGRAQRGPPYCSYNPASSQAAVDAAGLLVTVPLPVPLLFTFNVLGIQCEGSCDRHGGIQGHHAGTRARAAAAAPTGEGRAVAATALSVTTGLVAYVSEQSKPQSMPTGSLVTVPLPVPALETVKNTEKPR